MRVGILGPFYLEDGSRQITIGGVRTWPGHLAWTRSPTTSWRSERRPPGPAAGRWRTSRPASPARLPCGRASCPRHRSRPGIRPTRAWREMTSLSSSGPWEAGSSPMFSPPCSSATARPTCTRTVRSGRSMSQPPRRPPSWPDGPW